MGRRRSIGPMNSLPCALTGLRLLLGPLALICVFVGVSRWVYLPILVAGTLSDIFDGVLARRLGVATSALRRFDSITDAIYYLFILTAAWWLCRPVIVQNWPMLLLILLSEAAVVLTCYLKFGRYPATHSYLAKFYGLCLLGGIVALLVFNVGSWALIVLTLVALVTNAEQLAIHLLMDQPPMDIKSILALPKAEP